jgi:hypothetical protein
MTKNVSTFRRIVTRCLAAGVLLCIYCFSVIGTSALVLAASSTTADARRGGGGGVAEAVSVAAVFVTVAGDGVATQDRAAITAIAGVG